jgi:arginase family enzyme
VLDEVDCAYVAIDFDVLEPGLVEAFMPEPAGLSLEQAEEVLTTVRELGVVVGAGVSGLRADPGNVAPVERLLAALGL